MQKLIVFNNVSLDGYFTGANGDLSWAHRPPDDEWTAFIAGNAQSGGRLVFGRRTYDMMASFWPTPVAAQQLPVVAERMNAGAKVVFSKTLVQASWQNTQLAGGNLPDEIRRMKTEPGAGMTILGSGSLVPPLAEAGLIDEYQFVVVPVVLGQGRTLFAGLKNHLPLRLTKSRSFQNGNVLMCYAPA